MTITLYTKPSCVQCDATKKHLSNLGLSYQIVDLLEDESALATVKGLGYLAAPVVVVEDEHWSGYRPDKIEELKGKLLAAA